MMRLERKKECCQQCGTQLTDSFRRVYGDNENVCHRCHECDTKPRVSLGSAAGLDVDHTDPIDNPDRYHHFSIGGRSA